MTSGLFIEGGTVTVSGDVQKSHFDKCVIVIEGPTVFRDCRFIDVFVKHDITLDTGSIRYIGCVFDPSDIGPERKA